jgi:drug/metabolite transporter (DMT)-like permease
MTEIKTQDVSEKGMSTVTKAYIALFVVFIVWSTTLGAIRVGVQSFPPFLFVAMRFIIAGSLLFLICRLRKESWPDARSLKIHCFVGFLLFFCGHAMAYWALQYVSTGLLAIVGATSPFWLIWLTSVIPPAETVEKSALIGVSVGFLGMLFLLWPQIQHPGEFTLLFWACVVVLFAMSVFWCCGVIVSRKYKANTSLLMGTAIQNSTAGLLLLPIGLFATDWSHLAPAPESWMALAYLIFVGSMFATSCYLYVIQNLPVPVISTITYVTTVLTIFVGKWFLNETVTPRMLLGTAIILTGVVWVQWFNARATQREKPLSG